MRAKPDTNEPVDIAARRARARRTALLFAGIAVAIYVLFILSGVLAQ
jgi:hypothetical protein